MEVEKVANLRHGNGYLTFVDRLRQAGVPADLSAVEL